jgi:hypothetical protein
MTPRQTPIAYLDADELRDWWDRDARALAAVIRRVGKIEAQ